MDPIPAGVPSFQTLDRMGASFDERGAKTTVFVVMENSAGLSDNTRDRYHVLVDTCGRTTSTSSPSETC